MNEKQELLKSILTMVDKSVTKEEFLKAYKTLVEFVVKIEKKNGEEMDAMWKKLEKSISENEKSSETFFNDLKKEMLSIIPELKDGYTPIKGKDYFDGENGKDADEEKITSEILERMSEVLVSLEANEIRNKLETLQGENRLDVSAIKGIEEKLNELDAKITNVKGMRGMRKIPIVKRYRLTDQCNGVLKAFTLPADTVDVLGVFGSQFPINYDPYNSSGGDWTFAGRTLTLGSGVSAPETGQTLWALIETLFY